MIWTDRIRQVKIVLVVAAVIIAAASLVTSHYLVSDLKVEEQNRMRVWAEAMRSLNEADENTDLNLVLKVIDENNTIPVIVTDENGMVQTFRNVELHADNAADSTMLLTNMSKQWRKSGHLVRIDLYNSAFIEVTYDESLMIKRLQT
ncbi:MAG: ATP-binding protein, partial [Prevotella sp.]|nr:ATP-binding protein [Prevotella sp.]